MVVALGTLRDSTISIIFPHARRWLSGTVRQPFESLLSRLIITNIANQRIAELFGP
jgi:hypothetical protein